MLYTYFNILILLIILQCISIILSKNSIISILILVLVYLEVSICYLIIGAEFLAYIIIIVYTGAISILFIFIIMMINIRLVELYNILISYIPLGLFIGLILIIQYIYIIKLEWNLFSFFIFDFNNIYIESSKLLLNQTNLNLIAIDLYELYFYLLIFAGFILLVAMIGSIILTMNYNTIIIRMIIKKNYFYNHYSIYNINLIKI